MTLRTPLFFPALGLAYGLLSVGCKPTPAVDSSDIATHGMAMEVLSTDDGTHTQLQVKLWVGDAPNHGTLVTLSKDDSLALTLPSAMVLGVVASQGQGVIYGATLPSLDGGTLGIDLKRAKSASALGNSVTLPKGFTLTGPTANVSRASLATVSWTRADGGHVMRISADGDCIEHVLKTITGDPGTFTFNAGELKALGDPKASCSVKIVVVRELANGKFSAEFGHVSAGIATQLRSLTFTSTQ